MEQTTEAINRGRYLTRFSALTLALGLEPEKYVRDRIDWPTSKIRLELQKAADIHGLPMVHDRTIAFWKVKIGERIEQEKIDQEKLKKKIKH